MDGLRLLKRLNVRQLFPQTQAVQIFALLYGRRTLAGSFVVEQDIFYRCQIGSKFVGPSACRTLADFSSPYKIDLHLSDSVRGLRQDRALLYGSARFQHVLSVSVRWINNRWILMSADENRLVYTSLWFTQIYVCERR